MNNNIAALRESLICVHTSRDFENWVRTRLRKHLPHAALLVTLGRLFSSGSMPTHRIGVDYPLNLVEEVKTETGSINDPIVSSFLKSERLQYIELADWALKHGDYAWNSNLQAYGIESVLVHGVLDHDNRRFMTLHVVNPVEGNSSEVCELVRSIIGLVADSAWRTLNARSQVSAREAIGHPTALLSATELKIIQFLALGLSNKEIARRRGVSDSTIKTQVSRTGAKLGATRRSEIVAVGLSMLAPLPAQGMVDYDD